MTKFSRTESAMYSSEWAKLSVITEVFTTAVKHFLGSILKNDQQTQKKHSSNKYLRNVTNQFCK